MHQATSPPNGSAQPLVVVKAEPAGRYTASVVGLADICATAATRQAAIDEVRTILEQQIAAGILVRIELNCGNALMSTFGRVDPNDPDEQEYLEELARLRQEDLEKSVRQ